MQISNISFESTASYKMTIEARLLYVRFITDYRKQFLPGTFRLRNINYYKKICLMNGYKYVPVFEEVKSSGLLLVDRDIGYLTGLIKFFMLNHAFSIPRGGKLEWLSGLSFSAAWKDEYERTLDEIDPKMRERILVQMGVKSKEVGSATPGQILDYFAEQYKKNDHGLYFVGNIPELSQAARLAKKLSFNDIKTRINEFFEDPSNKNWEFMLFVSKINKYKGSQSDFEDDPTKSRYWEIVKDHRDA
jgi:hypothetical protein